MVAAGPTDVETAGRTLTPANGVKPMANAAADLAADVAQVESTEPLICEYPDGRFEVLRPARPGERRRIVFLEGRPFAIVAAGRVWG